MNIAYFSRPHRKNLTTGGNAHVGQFLDHAIAAGHTIWTPMPDDRADTRSLPKGPLRRLCALRNSDVFYFRLEWRARSQCRFGCQPYRTLLGNPLVAWELNTVPAYGRVLGHNEAEVAAAEQELRRLARGCDIAFAVSPALETYARETLGLRRVVMVPNGSDPNLFRPDAPSTLPVDADDGRLNVVWMGSASLAWHDLPAILAAAAEMEQAGWGARVAFHLIGAGTETLRGAAGSITCHGEVPYCALPGLLAGMHVGLALYQDGPALYNSPLKVFDYMASGLAVVAYDQPGFRLLFADMAAPNPLTPTGDVPALMRTLQALQRDRARVAACGRAGRQLVLARYTWAQSVGQTLAELERGLAERA